MHEHERDSPKVNVWCALTKTEVIGPFFFAEVTINSNVYLDMLEGYALPQIEAYQPHVLFQLDGAPPHWARIVRNVLDHNFPDRWIGRGGPISWPPRSPDITPLDFFLWGYVKDRVYRTKVRDLQILRARITEAIASVTPEMLANVWREVEYRLDIARATSGAHIQVY